MLNVAGSLFAVPHDHRSTLTATACSEENPLTNSHAFFFPSSFLGSMPTRTAEAAFLILLPSSSHSSLLSQVPVVFLLGTIYQTMTPSLPKGSCAVLARVNPCVKPGTITRISCFLFLSFFIFILFLFFFSYVFCFVLKGHI